MPEDTALPEYAVRNRTHWTQNNAEYTNAKARESWAREEITWGVWGTPESELQALPDVRGLDVIELGCGTAYFGAWLRKAGARRVVGVDITPAQLATAREMNDEFGLGIEFIEGNAESVPLPDDSFDLAFSEYGASIWCDPYKWIPEAARLLRPGGELVFLVNSIFTILCGPDDETIPVGDRLLRPLFGMHRVEWPGEDSVEFHLPPGKMIALLDDCGLELTGLIEVRPPADTTKKDPHVPLEWARRYPSEEGWRARKRG